MKRLWIDIAGMHCDHCVATIATKLRSAAGVRETAVSLGQARVAFDDDVIDVANLLRIIRSAGDFDVTGYGPPKD